MGMDSKDAKQVPVARGADRDNRISRVHLRNLASWPRALTGRPKWDRLRLGWLRPIWS